MRGNEGGKGGKKRVRMVKFINKRRRRWREGGRHARPISLIQPLAAPRCWMLVSFLTCGALSWPHGFPLCRFAFCSICSVDSIASRPIIAHQRSVITGCFIGLFVFVFFFISAVELHGEGPGQVESLHWDFVASNVYGQESGLEVLINEA